MSFVTLRLNFACKIAATATADNLGQRAERPERRATTQVMLGVSLRARWDVTLVPLMIV